MSLPSNPRIHTLYLTSPYIHYIAHPCPPIHIPPHDHTNRVSQHSTPMNPPTTHHTTPHHTTPHHTTPHHTTPHHTTPHHTTPHHTTPHHTTPHHPTHPHHNPHTSSQTPSHTHITFTSSSHPPALNGSIKRTPNCIFSSISFCLLNNCKMHCAIEITSIAITRVTNVSFNVQLCYTVSHPSTHQPTLPPLINKSPRTPPQSTPAPRSR
jgi:hypothetical protein